MTTHLKLLLTAGLLLVAVAIVACVQTIGLPGTTLTPIPAINVRASTTPQPRSIIIQRAVLPFITPEPSPTGTRIVSECFPTCASDDSKMLVSAGSVTSQMATLSDLTTTIDLWAGNYPTVTLGIFDPDSPASLALSLTNYWDLTITQNSSTVYTLNGIVTATDAREEIASWTAADLVNYDNAWYPYAFATNADYWDDPYFRYELVVAVAPAAGDWLNAYKVGFLDGRGVVMIAANETWSYIGAWPYPATPPPNYDGEWSWSFTVPAGITDTLTFWDGDFDYGSSMTHLGGGFAVNDTNDPDSSGIPDFNTSPWATPEAYVGYGAPYEDNVTEAEKRRAPPITYRLFDAVGRVFTNTNPSGNREWEGFRIQLTSVPGGCGDPQMTPPPAAYTADYCVDAIAAGSWIYLAEGVDVDNLNAAHISYALSAAETPTLTPTITPTNTPTPGNTPSPTSTPSCNLGAVQGCATMVPAIDGELADWSGVTGFTVDGANFVFMSPLTPTPSAADIAATFFCAHDDTNLYLSGVVTDTQVYSSTTYSIDNGDAVQIGVDALADGQYAPRVDDHEIYVAPNNRVRDYVIYPIQHTSAVSVTASGWQWELSIAATDLGGHGVAGGANMCMAFGVFDNDTGGNSYWDHYLWGGWARGAMQ